MLHELESAISVVGTWTKHIESIWADRTARSATQEFSRYGGAQFAGKLLAHTRKKLCRFAVAAGWQTEPASDAISTPQKERCELVMGLLVAVAQGISSHQGSATFANDPAYALVHYPVPQKLDVYVRTAGVIMSELHALVAASIERSISRE